MREYSSGLVTYILRVCLDVFNSLQKLHYLKKILHPNIPLGICRWGVVYLKFWLGLFLLCFWRHTPLQIIHIIANFLRIWSIYSMFRYLSQTGASVVLFLFACLAPAAILFLILQKPWKGRPLTNTQVILISTISREYSRRSFEFYSNLIMICIFLN